MAEREILAVDLGQSGCRIKLGELLITSDRGKLAGEMTLTALRAVFETVNKFSADVVALSCTGFNGIVLEPEKYGAICQEFFGAKQVAVIDDGLAGFIGALQGCNGVVLTIGGGVVSVGGLGEKFAHRDGLGSTFGDEGGGFWLGKLAITKALGIRQGRGSDLEMLEYFSDECIEYDNLIIKNGTEAATFAIKTAKKVLVAAEAGIPTAKAIVDEGARLLAQTVAATWQGVGGTISDSPEIIIQGGPAGNNYYWSKIGLEVNSKLPNASVIKSNGDNLDGAIWIAKNMHKDVPPLLMWSRI